MVSSLEEYVAKATSAFQPSTTAIQNQIEGLAGKLDATNEAINKNYAQQQARLDLNRNQAAETASMQAAGSGGSFGGAANLANRKYYDQTFVPAVTQMRTNQANELSAARQANDDTRNNLNSQLSSLLSQANQQGLSQYYSDTNADLARQFEAAEAEKQRQYAIAEAEKQRQYQIAEAEKQRQFQAEQAALDRENSRRAAAASAAAQNSYYDRIMEAMAGGGGNQPLNKSSIDFNSWVQNYSNFDDNTKNYLISNINKIANTGSSAMQAALSQALQNSAPYKQYLNWRNS